MVAGVAALVSSVCLQIKNVLSAQQAILMSINDSKKSSLTAYLVAEEEGAALRLREAPDWSVQAHLALQPCSKFPSNQEAPLSASHPQNEACLLCHQQLQLSPSS